MQRILRFCYSIILSRTMKYINATTIQINQKRKSKVIKAEQ